MNESRQRLLAAWDTLCVRFEDECRQHYDTQAKLDASRMGEAEAMAVVLGLEGTVERLTEELESAKARARDDESRAMMAEEATDTVRAELETMESFVKQIDDAGHLLAKEAGRPYDRATCWGEAALDVAARVKRQGTERDRLIMGLTAVRYLARYDSHMNQTTKRVVKLRNDIIDAVNRAFLAVPKKGGV